MNKTQERPLRLKEFKKGFSVLDGKISGVERRLDGMEKRLDGVDKRLGSVEKRLESKIEAQGRGLRAEIYLAVGMAEERIDEKARQYRDQILTAFDQFLVEIRTAREERPVMAAQIANHEDRLEKLESKVFTPAAAQE